MKKIICIIVVFLGAINLNAQIYVKSTGQTLAENAVEGSFVIVKQSYQVKDKKTGKTFGQNGRADFGHSYSLGVMTNMGLVITNDALKPWITDGSFKKIENSYDPVISFTEVRPIEGKEIMPYNQCPLHIGSSQPEGLWIADIGKVNPNAMEIDGEKGKKNGWIIWLTAKQSLENNPDAVLLTQALNKEIDINGNEDVEIEAPNGNDFVLGGAYVCPYYTGGGHVSFRLVGMILKDDNKWKLHAPFDGLVTDRPSKSDGQSAESSKSEEEINLTPIGQEKKKTKNNKK